MLPNRLRPISWRHDAVRSRGKGIARLDCQPVPARSYNAGGGSAKDLPRADPAHHGAPVQAARIEDRTIRTPQGDIPIRVYTPEGNEAFPALIYFHGGGWVIGDLDTHQNLCCDFAYRGRSVVVAVDYRLAPEHKFPRAVEDCYAATQWVAAHANELRIDP